MLLRVRFRVVVSVLLAILGLSGAAAERVPEPKDVFGFKPGDDYKLASHAQIVDLLPSSSTPLPIASSSRTSARASKAGR